MISRNLIEIKIIFLLFTGSMLEFSTFEKNQKKFSKKIREYEKARFCLIKQPYIEENAFMCYNIHTYTSTENGMQRWSTPHRTGGSAAQEYSLEKIRNILDCKVEALMEFILDDKE